MALMKLPTLPARLRPLVEEMSGSRIRAVSESAFGKTGLIPLWFGESDRVTPPFVNEGAKKALDAGHTFYTPNRGIPALREAVAGYGAMRPRRRRHCGCDCGIAGSRD